MSTKHRLPTAAAGALATGLTGNATTTIMNARALGVPEGGVHTFIYANYGVPLCDLMRRPAPASEVYTDKYLPPAADLKIAPWHPGQ